MRRFQGRAAACVLAVAAVLGGAMLAHPTPLQAQEHVSIPTGRRHHQRRHVRDRRSRRTFAGAKTGDWTELRNRWEISHVIRAGLATLSLISIAVATSLFYADL